MLHGALPGPHASCITRALDETTDHGAATVRTRGCQLLTPLAHRGAGEVAGEVIGQVARVILGAVDEGRLAAPEKGQSDGIQAWRIDNSAIMPQLALGIHDRNIEPAIVGAKPGRPDDGTDLATPEGEIKS